MSQVIDQALSQLNQVVLGKETQLKMALACLLAKGHLLIEDLPGMGKTTLSHALASALSLQYNRIQFTSDLLPADILGVSIFEKEPGTELGRFRFHPGPVFSQLLLADEINRATPRTQSALLEVMAEHQVTVDGVSRPVPTPFFVIATQNPVEYQGTFPLPEAQMDRFMLCFSLGYPSEKEEMQMLQRLQLGKTVEQVSPCLTLAELQELQQICTQIRVEVDIQEYILDLVRNTRQDEEISLGVSPRGTVALQKAAQARAFLEGRDYVLHDDIKFLASYVLAHRLIPISGRRGTTVIERLLRSVPVGV